MDDSHQTGVQTLGAWGESLAARRLRLAGWTILERNYRWGRKEVDLIARRGAVLAFVEVKTRAGAGYGEPEEAVTRRKRREIESVARAYLRQVRPRCSDIRFDVVGIVVDGRRNLLRYTHLSSAWRVWE